MILDSALKRFITISFHNYTASSESETIRLFAVSSLLLAIFLSIEMARDHSPSPACSPVTALTPQTSLESVTVFALNLPSCFIIVVRVCCLVVSIYGNNLFMIGLNLFEISREIGV